MIHVRYPNGGTPPPDWLEKARAITAELRVAPDRLSREKIIEANAPLWGDIKDWLEGFSFGKCWFSEARDTCSYWHVEHFRPKKQIIDSAGIRREGYWWLTFDYLNYRLAGGVVNTKKGSYFPLREGSLTALGPEDNCDDEAPLLLDPTIEGDVALLTFVEAGIAMPSRPDTEGWDHLRAKMSIERYKLNDYSPLCRGRAGVWNDCKHDLERLEYLMREQQAKHSPSRAQEIRIIIKRLRDRTERSSIFSSVARAFLLQYPAQWTRQLVV